MPDFFTLDEYIEGLDTSRMAILTWVEPETKTDLEKHVGHTMSLETSSDIIRLHCYDCDHDVLAFWDRPEEDPDYCGPIDECDLCGDPIYAGGGKHICNRDKGGDVKE